MDALTRHKLVTATIEYDKRTATSEAKKGYRHNPYRLGILLKSIEGVAEDVAEGASLARALYDHANGRFLTNLEKSVGLEPTYGGGGQDRGRPA